MINREIWRRGLPWLAAMACLLLATGVQAQAVHADAGTAQRQIHRDWSFPVDGVSFSNRLEGARLNGVERVGADHYAVIISPESTPINPSPWYGFSVTAKQAKPLAIEFHYQHGEARYRPKLSDDKGASWHEADAQQFRKLDDGVTELRVTASPHPLGIFAQPPLGLATFVRWEAQLAGRLPVHTQVVGQSVQGRPLRMLSFGSPRAKSVLVVIGRQHPPETTGSQALMSFVDALAADTPLARRFRAQVLTVVVPVLNPDGVVEGNWRGNADGTDLNRDWGVFHEPETRAVSAALQHQSTDAGRRVVFAIDFHSTWSDVFYTVTEDPSRAPGGILRNWMDGMQQRYPGRIREKPHAADTSVFKNWAFKHFHAPTVTYEVGDKTDAAQLRTLAGFAADSLMQLLLTRPPTTR